MSVLTFGRSDPRWLVLILVLSALAAVVLSLATWFLLPLVELAGSQPFESETSRLLVILAIVLLWGVTNAVLRARQNSANQARLDALDRQEFERRVEVDAAKQGAETEFAEIKAGARHALRLAHGRRLIDILLQRGRSLPRYLVIGPSGSGKTSILESANLTLPYDPREDDLAATRACRFVASDRAVFVDVAGEVALAKIEDREKLWQRLLGLLRNLRRLQPINGVIVVVGAIDLANLDEEERADLARSLRGRLDEISQRLGARVPVYLLFSKLDRVPGFAEFFDNLGADERTQVWGVPLAVSEQTTATQAAPPKFGDGFDDLVRRASTRQLGFLYSEPDEARRTLAFEFPAQFAALRDRLTVFLEELIRRSRFDEPPMLRGVFLSSALQDGTSVDAIGGVLAPTFALAADGGTPGRARGIAMSRERVRRRPYFLKRLFSDIILAEAGAGRLTENARRAAHFWSYAVRAGVALLIIIGLIQLWSSYHNVDIYITDVMAASGFRASPATSESSADATDFGSKLVTLNNLAHLATVAEAPVSSSFDVVQPIRDAADAAYRQGLSDFIVPPTLHGLEALLADPATSAADRFQGLKLYLLLGSGRSPPASLMTELAPKLADGFVGLGKDATSRQQTVDHLVALSLVPVPAQDLDQNLVKQTRRRLNAATVAEIGYEIMRRRPTLTALKPWRPIDYAGSLGPRAVALLSGKPLTSGVPGLFTAAAIGDVADASASVSTSLAADAWVFAADASEQPNLSTRAVQSGILKLYQADYVRTWDTLLSDLTLPTLPTASAGAELIAILNGQDSPILQLLNAVATETSLDKRAEDKIIQGLKPKGASFAVFGAALSRPEILPLMSATRTAISSQFAGLREALARPKDGQVSEVDAILKGFDPLYRQLLLIGSGAAPPSETETPAGNMVLTVAAINRLPLSIRPYFLRLASDASSLVKVNLLGRAAQVWAESIRPVCESTITKAFPFDLTAPGEVPLGEFTRVFSPNGLIATFRRTKLANLVDTSVRPWRWRGSRAAPSDPPDPTLAMFERADAITAAFFAEGDNPGVRFTAVPLRLDPKITRLQFDIGGASLVYAHGPTEPFIGRWPPPIADAPATLSVQPEADGAVNSLVGTGPWGLFRLIAQASKVARKPDAMLFAFNMGRRPLALKLSTPTLQNAFDLNQTAGFTCPEF